MSVDGGSEGRPATAGAGTGTAPVTGAAWDLGRAEQRLVRAAATGVACDLDGADDRVVRGEVLAALVAGGGPVDGEGRPCWAVHRIGVELVGATVEGEVDLRHAEIAAPLVLRSCRFTGRLRLDDATTSSLHLEDTELARGFEGDGLSVDGSLYFDAGFRSPSHQVRLLHASISRNLYCLGAGFGGRLDRDGRSTEHALVADGTRVEGSIQWRRHPRPPGNQTTAAGIVRLVGVTAGSLADELDQWPERVQLRGFVYGQIMSDAPNLAVGGRIRWVRASREPVPPRRRDRLARWWGRFRGPTDHSPTSPQPYQQLAKVYRELGRDVDARAVLRARWRDELAEGPSQARKVPLWLWRWVLQVTVGNGYQPARIIPWFAALVVAGLLVVGAALDQGVLLSTAVAAEGRPAPTADTCTREFDCLDPLPYVLDVLTPFDLGEQGDWRVDDTAGVEWRLALWIGIVLGWVLSAILVASFTPLVRRE